MATKVHGSESVVIHQKLSVGEDGIGTLTLTFFSVGIPTIPQLGSAPDVSVFTAGNLGLADIDVSTVEGGFEMVLTYKGVIEDGISIFSIEGGVSEESIQTHPLFSSWAGTEKHPNSLNAYWEPVDTSSGNTETDTGKSLRFVGFKRTAQNNLGGVESYLTGNLTVCQTNTYAAGSGIDLPRCGSVLNPNTPGWNLGSNANFLLESYQVEKHGAAYRVTRRFRQSGPGGWNQYIYPFA